MQPKFQLRVCGKIHSITKINPVTNQHDNDPFQRLGKKYKNISFGFGSSENLKKNYWTFTDFQRGNQKSAIINL